MSQNTRKPGSGRMSTGLVALGSAAVFAVYSAGYFKTKAAAARFEDPRGPRRASIPPGQPMPGTMPPPSSASGADLTPATAVSAAAPQPPVTLAVPTMPANRASTSVVQADGGVAATRAATATTATPAAAGITPIATAAGAAPGAAAAAPLAGAPSAQPEPASTTAPASTAVAASSSPVPAVATPVPVAKYKDGTFTGWGSCRHGDIQAELVIAGGRITSATISQCLTRYNCSWISPLPPQVVQRQSPEVDYVSGATDSAIAFYGALVDALAKAK